jgi:hypothetical protein
MLITEVFAKLLSCEGTSYVDLLDRFERGSSPSGSTTDESPSLLKVELLLFRFKLGSGVNLAGVLEGVGSDPSTPVTTELLFEETTKVEFLFFLLLMADFPSVLEGGLKGGVVTLSLALC